MEVLYLNQINLFLFVLKMFFLQIEEMKLKNDFLNLNKTFFSELTWSDKKKSSGSNKIIFLCFKFFFWIIIFSLLNDPLNNNFANLENKIIYFRLRPNFCECTTLVYLVRKVTFYSRSYITYRFLLYRYCFGCILMVIMKLKKIPQIRSVQP